MQYNQRARWSDQVARAVFFLCAMLLVVIILAVIIFISSKAFNIFFEHGGTNLKTFLFTDNWDPTGVNDPTGNGHPGFGAGGLILGSIVITLASVLLVIPLALGTAVFFTEAAPRWLVSFLKPLIEIFTGVPSVVIGVLGLTVLVPFVSNLLTPFAKALGIVGATAGFGWGAAILVLVIMVLPTTLSVAIDALHAVPASVREASLALGSTHWQMMRKAIIPAAASGLGTAVILGMARAIGETLAVELVLGGNALPKHLFSLGALFQPSVNITASIAEIFPETSGISQDAYWTLAFILLAITFLFICLSRYLTSRSVYR